MTIKVLHWHAAPFKIQQMYLFSFSKKEPFALLAASTLGRNFALAFLISSKGIVSHVCLRAGHSESRLLW